MYWGDYLADTAHFTNAEHGAYMLLIAFYWTNGKLPEDEEAIRRIAKASAHQWKKMRPVLVEKFSTEWKHKRIDTELAKSLEKSRTNSANAKRRHSERTADAQRSDTQSLSQSQREDKTELRSAENVSCETIPIESPASGEAQYEFEGVVIKLRKKNFIDWVKAYPAIDIRGELTARDAWLASDRATPADKSNWFISTSKYLANRNMEARAKSQKAPEFKWRSGIEGVV